jgi:hypothetical protein
VVIEPGERVSVKATYNADLGRTQPFLVRWRDRILEVKELGYYHRERLGRATQHVFSVSAGPPGEAAATIALRLRLDGETLAWILEGADGDGPTP